MAFAPTYFIFGDVAVFERRHFIKHLRSTGGSSFYRVLCLFYLFVAFCIVLLFVFKFQDLVISKVSGFI